MPAGRYISITGQVTAHSGGQTRAFLLRNRLLRLKAGIEPVLASFDSAPDYPQIRESLHRQGQLVDGMTLVNMFEWLREQPLEGLDAVAPELPELSDYEERDVQHPDGSVYYTSYLSARGSETLRDYRRPDGSVYLRVPIQGGDTARPPTPILLVDAAGRPVGSWAKQRGLRQAWMLQLAGDAERVFLISDSRFVIAHVAGMADPRFHVLHVVHNLHVAGDRRWNSTVSPQYVPLMNCLPNLDALITLTGRQGEDIATRFGETNNLFVIPNPVELPERPDPLPDREARRFAVVSRLDEQKRLQDAVSAFALVVKEEPDAVLDIYGAGKLRLVLQEQIDSLGVAGSVFLRGHDPRARDVLWTSTGFLMTSRFEGYPLATLESLSHGCPVLSYDIKYGPREQITDGVDGYLVPEGDVQQLADRVVRLIRDPELVRRMSAAALHKAGQHDYRRFLADWRGVLEAVIRQKPSRTSLKSARLTVTRLSYESPIPAPSLLGRLRLPARFTRSSSAGAFRTAPVIDFAGRLKVVGQGGQASLDDARVTLEAVSALGSVIPVPLSATRSGATFELAARVDLVEVFAGALDEDRGVRLRLRLVWNNSSWETTVRRAGKWAANYEVCFTDDDELALLRGPSA